MRGAKIVFSMKLEARPLRPFLLAYLTPGTSAKQSDLDPATALHQSSSPLLLVDTCKQLPREARRLALRCPPFRPFGCGRFARRPPIAIKAAVVAT